MSLNFILIKIKIVYVDSLGVDKCSCVIENVCFKSIILVENDVCGFNNNNKKNRIVVIVSCLN